MTISKQDQVTQIASKHLGQKGGEGYKDQYDPTLLVKVPRQLNRDAYGIEEGKLPFVGVDTWNAYEVSALTEKGLPVSGMVKIIVPADSEYHVESKSLKLYLNSFNMTKIGKESKDVVSELRRRITEDLSNLLEAKVVVSFFSVEFGHGLALDWFVDIATLTDLDKLDFTSFQSDSSQLEKADPDEPRVIAWRSNLLRSNCRVTHQPDWGDIFIQMEGTDLPTPESLAKYIVSHRTVSHFHEEICEMVYTHLNEAFRPKKMMVACLYTRRGGIDINPIRASHPELVFTPFTTTGYRLEKTLRQ